MIEGEDFMFHSHISFYLNNGLLEPLEVVKLVEEEYKNGKINIAAAEGFVRQILGWREYIRGVYWLKMPEYKESNFFNAKNKLPNFYWTGNTKMNCLKESVRNTKENSYAHHIQRLMVLGNFALIFGVDPKEINEWYLIVYADAYEWVELPNVLGMILFADGGVLATKPYAASGAYINKMSNYCKNCSYFVEKKNGIDACPFNYLYWNFLIKNKKSLGKNRRMSMIYNVLEKFDQEKLKAIKDDSERFLKQINSEN
jgi:deoxyribodipyrimidine photolyase-related protein